MTFFVTSTGSGAMGGNLGGLAGADAKCTQLAGAVGGGDHTWRAYLSVPAGGGQQAVNAKDRIGAGPWTNQKGKVVANTVAELHGANFNLLGADLVDEKGAAVPAAQHDILTGSNRDGTLAGRDTTCSAWTSNTNANATVGHTDSDTSANAADAWNNAHTVGCTQQALARANGAGRTYCFATD